MPTPNKRVTTYRLTPELDKKITEEARRVGLSKNAFVQYTLSIALGKVEDKQIKPTGTE